MMNAMLTKPLVIYLDSSDISVLSNPATRSKDIIEIEASLFNLRNSGLIEFRFSHIHIIESAPKDENSIIFAKQRLSYLSTLCGRKCLSSYVDILEHEISNLVFEEKRKQFEIYNDNSEWFPELEVEESLSLKGMINEHLQSIPDRKQRRQAEQKYFSKNGNVRKEILLRFNSHSSESIKSITEEYPLTSDEVNLYLKSIVHGNSDQHLNEIIKKAFSEIERLPAWYEKQWDRLIPCSSYLRDIGSNLKTSIQKYSDESKVTYENWVSLGLSETEIKFNQNKIFEMLLLTMPQGLAEKLAESMGLKLNIEKLTWETVPSLLTATTLSSHIARKAFYSGGTSRTARVSDFGDISHAFYLPHVDIFRADGFIAATISESNLPFKTSVVGSLHQLIEVINKRLA